jgi:hypothetical protein
MRGLDRRIPTGLPAAPSEPGAYLGRSGGARALPEYVIEVEAVAVI